MLKKQKNILSQGEDSRHQFKSDFTNANGLAAEISALSNSMGGAILIGVSDNGEILGLSRERIGHLNQLISNTSSQNVHPPVNPVTEILTLDTKRILIVHIQEGILKPYMDNQGVIWVKSGADKRRVTSREEVQRIFQSSSLIHGDEMSVRGASFEKVDDYYFKKLFQKVIEITSPGSLPDSLTIVMIKNGISHPRNTILSTFASKVLVYKGLGNGVRRAIKEYPYIDFENDNEANQFKVIVKRVLSSDNESLLRLEKTDQKKPTRKSNYKNRPEKHRF